MLTKSQKANVHLAETIKKNKLAYNNKLEKIKTLVMSCKGMVVTTGLLFEIEEIINGDK